ncbi:unnamed protein product, partial [Polarella glacialis]
VGPIIRGSYTLASENHDRPVYRKDEKVGAKGLDVMLYYWDDRDSPDFSGWWFGPQIGGDEVWAFHKDTAARNPPSEGWQCPFDGPVDATIRVLPKAASSVGAVSATQRVVPQAVPARAVTQAVSATQRVVPQAVPATRVVAPATQRVAPQTAQTPGPVQKGGPVAKPAPAVAKPAVAKPAAPAATAVAKPAVPAQDEAKRRRELAEAEKQKQMLKQVEELKSRQRHAQLVVRRVLQRLRLAKPETFKDLMAELQKVMISESAGLLHPVRLEAEKVKKEAKLRVEKITLCKSKAEKRKQAAASERQARAKAAQALIEETERLAEAAETAVESLSSMALPDTATGEKEVEDFGKDMLKSEQTSLATHQAFAEFVKKHRAAMEQVAEGPTRPGKAKVDALAMRAE